MAEEIDLAQEIRRSLTGKFNEGNVNNPINIKSTDRLNGETMSPLCYMCYLLKTNDLIPTALTLKADVGSLHNNKTPLMIFLQELHNKTEVKRAHVDVLGSLIEATAQSDKINHADNEGKTALCYALELWTKMKGDEKKDCAKIIQLLIQRGANVKDTEVQKLLDGNPELKTLVEGAVKAVQAPEEQSPKDPNEDVKIGDLVPVDGTTTTVKNETTTIEDLEPKLKGLYKKYVAGTISAAELEEMKKLEGEFVSVAGDRGESMRSLLAEAGREFAETERQKLSTQVEQAKNAAYQQGFEAGKKQSGGGGSGPEPGKEKELKEKENLPPEAVVQQPEKESFWNWKNILWLLGIAATLGLSLWFVKREKDKVKDAKKETATLQKEVNSLQNQLDDLTKDTATLTPVDTHDGATLASSAIRYTDSIVNVSSRADKSNC
ncbi:MAG: hypothetical protein IJY58_04785 [Alphaproteobacteria bacterium]|nr:hypothetical protein [Alphaproteobacteria bacterium]